MIAQQPVYFVFAAAMIMLVAQFIVNGRFRGSPNHVGKAIAMFKVSLLVTTGFLFLLFYLRPSASNLADLDYPKGTSTFESREEILAILYSQNETLIGSINAFECLLFLLVAFLSTTFYAFRGLRGVGVNAPVVESEQTGDANSVKPRRQIESN